jgi:hypothetical protein
MIQGAFDRCKWLPEKAGSASSVCLFFKRWFMVCRNHNNRHRTAALSEKLRLLTVLFNRLDARGLDDRPPFLELGLLERAERVGRLLIPSGNFLAQIGYAHAPRSANASTTAAFSLATASLGVCFGTQTPRHTDT